MTQSYTPPVRGSWSNWTGNIQSPIQRFVQPRLEAEVTQLIEQTARHGQSIRVVGAGHSFTPVAATEGLLLNLDYLSGLEGIDKSTGQVTIKAGTRLFDLNTILAQAGRAQENMGDINRQSLAGAISTGTHGTGLSLGGMHTQVESLRIIDGLGCTRVIDATTPNLLAAAQVSLGALGVITAVTLRTVPAYPLKMAIGRGSLNDMLENSLSYAHQHRHFEFYWMPHTDTVQTKRTDLTDQPPNKASVSQYVNDVLVENGALWILSEVNRLFPSMTRRVCQLIASAIGANTRIAASHDVFGSRRWVRFMEMEYGLPVEALSPALADLRDLIKHRQFPISFPIEVRYGAGDEAMLSMAHGRDTGFIAIHAYKGVDYQDYFREAEAIFRAYGGRPHWGKWHHLNARDLEQLYPRFQDFLAIRDQLDPERRFSSPYLTSLLGD